MPKKRYKPEEIVTKLRQVDVLVSQGSSVADARQARFTHWSANVLQRHNAEASEPTAERTVNPAGTPRGA